MNIVKRMQKIQTKKFGTLQRSTQHVRSPELTMFTRISQTNEMKPNLSQRVYHPDVSKSADFRRRRNDRGRQKSNTPVIKKNQS
jgi:hypothetical protein